MFCPNCKHTLDVAEIELDEPNNSELVVGWYCSYCGEMPIVVIAQEDLTAQ